MKNEAVFVGFKLLLSEDGNIYMETVDTPNKDIDSLFQESDWIYLNAAINAARRGIRDTIKGIEKEVGVF